MRIVIRTITFICFFVMSAAIDSPAQNIGHYADVNGLHMYYEIHGAGKPIVLIHGGGSTIISNWSKILPLFAKTRQVIAVELQAHGRTPDNGRVTTFESDADDVAALLQHLKIKEADVLGFSNGGNTTMQLAIRHPELVGKIIVASAFYKREGMAAGFWDGMANTTLANMPQGLKDAYLAVSPRPQDLQIMFDRDAKRMNAFKDWKDEDIQSIKAPAFVIAADNDVMTVEHTTKMYRLFPHATLSILPGLHGEYLGEVEVAKKGSRTTERFVDMVNEFLDASVAKP